MKQLPIWAAYVIAGLAAVVMILLGVSGTLVKSDRQNISDALNRVEKAIVEHQTKFDQIVKAQNEQISEVAKHNDRQNHIMDKMCWLLTLSYPDRMKLFDKYPAIMKQPNHQIER